MSDGIEFGSEKLAFVPFLTLNRLDDPFRPNFSDANVIRVFRVSGLIYREVISGQLRTVNSSFTGKI